VGWIVGVDLNALINSSRMCFELMTMTINIAVFGMGYVGIPIAALLADVGLFQVTGIQRRSKRSGWKIDFLNSGKSPFKGKEPGLDELIGTVVRQGRFNVTDDPSVCASSEYILIDVQTPTDWNRIPQYESLKEVCSHIGKYMQKGTTVIVESTVAPGTTENIVLPILEQESGMKGGEDFYLAFSYERVMPGKLLEYIIHMPRVVGGIEATSTEKTRWLYSHIVEEEIHTASSCIAAELAKTIENSYRDVNIAFANEMALVCESMGVNVFETIDLINARDDRHMHLPGAGVGGHCLPKDPWLLRYGIMKYGSFFREPEFISLARRINDHMPVHIVELINDALSRSNLKFRDAVLTILGIAYLEDSDDTRNTPARSVISLLKSRNTEIRLHDPYISELDGILIEEDFWKATNQTDCVVLITKHSQYYDIDLPRLKDIMRTPIIIDGRNVFDREKVEKLGFVYGGVGKGHTS
jgi:UDP-N-acetyl-D-mannosaminuronic acid dehydrogenase